MNGRTVLRVLRGFTLFRCQVSVFDENEALIGWFKQRLLTIGGKFDVFDASGSQVATLKGKWHSWDWRFQVFNATLK
jgi:hypothetical protein